MSSKQKTKQHYCCIVRCGTPLEAFDAINDAINTRSNYKMCVKCRPHGRVILSRVKYIQHMIKLFNMQIARDMLKDENEFSPLL